MEKTPGKGSVRCGIHHRTGAGGAAPSRDGSACALTVVDEYGQRHTIEVEARSVYHAACLFYGRSAAGASPGEKLPKTKADTIFEVRPIGEERVYQVAQKRMLAWANEEASRTSA